MSATTGLGEELRRHLTLHQRQLMQYQEIERRDFPPETGEGDDRLQHAILRAGIAMETFWIEWLTQTVRDLPDP
ncbi:hypothetical protein [Micromonospora kangleipakensis]|uniref:hypothetical protein n=1 Tax=Micromonospora kangleipakensis TaxID=1077942 RepID=UPI001029E7CE|nr:hypothetical protein [Micromonospora kangleipakensis]